MALPHELVTANRAGAFTGSQCGFARGIKPTVHAVCLVGYLYGLNLAGTSAAIQVVNGFLITRVLTIHVRR